MKLRTMLTVVVVLLAMGSTVVMGQAIEASATRDVYATVTPGLTVVPGPSGSVDIGSVGGVGTLTGTVEFNVHANVQEVDFYVVATCLYKGDDPFSEYIIPVAGPGCTVDPALGNAVQPADNDLIWTSETLISANAIDDGTVTVSNTANLLFNSMLASQSEQQEFESGQNNRFSQNVDVIVTWEQIQPELPVGVYSGFVKLVGVL